MAVSCVLSCLLHACSRSEQLAASCSTHEIQDLAGEALAEHRASPSDLAVACPCLSQWLAVPICQPRPSTVRILDTHVITHPCHCMQIKVMGTRDKAEEADFSTVPLEEHEATVLKEAAMISMGTEISMEDMLNIEALCDQVGSLLKIGVVQSGSD